MISSLIDLTMHHTIEEQHIFPVLATRMPTFGDNEAHLKSHHGIHEGKYSKLPVIATFKKKSDRT
jgi:hypothetical protein